MAHSRSTSRATVLPVLAGALIASTAHAETYHVDPGGSDGATGLSGAPWATLQHAADQVVAGDTVMVAAGTYVGFALTTGGTDGSPITFQAAEGVTVDTDNGSTPDGINVEGADYVVIEGFNLVGLTRAGIRCALSNFVTIRNNTAADNGVWGIFSGFCDDILVEANDCSGSVDEHGVYVSNSADRPTVRGNVLWNNNANGLHMNGDSGMGGDGVIEEALVEGNIIFGNGNG
ncbi:MAG: right-handed parallel beta-helix repeat-containing protein, partial [Deltaproteobacteria bacterium]|nr:right-handed parallel beta-helix repeat-containing protein [Deltaproteobacteria bacterium]